MTSKAGPGYPGTSKVDDDFGSWLSERIDTSSPEGCWTWMMGLTVYGYAQTSVRKRKWFGHRLVYSRLVGDIPEGADLDHECHNRAVASGTCSGGVTCRHRRCVNPSHMRLATRRENLKSGSGQSMTHCPRGHLYEGENLIVGEKNERRCRECINRRQRERHHRMMQDPEFRERERVRSLERHRKKALDPKERERANALRRAAYWRRKVSA